MFYKTNQDASTDHLRIKAGALMNDSYMRSKTSRALAHNGSSRQLVRTALVSPRQASETSREHVNSARRILLKEISILDKDEEKNKMMQFLKTEQESLEKSKIMFESDKERYEKFLETLKMDVAIVEENVKELQNEKVEKDEEIHM